MPHKAPTHKPHASTIGKQHRVRTEDDQWYSQPAWRRVRLWYLHQHPLCADPFGRHREDHVTVPAIDVHHKLKRRENRASQYSTDDLEALCHACHSVITAREKLGTTGTLEAPDPDGSV